MTRSTKTKPTLQHKPMACVSVNYESFLLPFADAQKLTELMTRAVHCRENYSGGTKMQYVVVGQPQVSLNVVMPDQVTMPPPDSVAEVPAGKTVVAVPSQPRLRGAGSAA